MPPKTTSGHPVDVHVGRRLNERRKLMHLSQENMAEAMGVTFQQIQKYCVGHNRVSASRLWLAAKILQVNVGYFFEGLPDGVKPGATDPMRTDMAIELVRLWMRLDAVAAEMLMNFLRRISRSVSEGPKVRDTLGS